MYYILTHNFSCIELLFNLNYGSFRASSLSPFFCM